MTKPKTIANFPLCINCGSDETISQIACAPLKESGKIPQDAFTSLKQQMTPLETPAKAIVSVQMITAYFDICAKCGQERCTRVQIVQMPIQMPPQQTGGGGFNPFLH
jgi:hypothetical protein